MIGLGKVEFHPREKVKEVVTMPSRDAQVLRKLDEIIRRLEALEDMVAKDPGWLARARNAGRWYR